MGLAPGTRVGPYEIVHLLGAGGMGEVYRAHDAKLARDVAVKILPTATLPNADRLARFHREARVLATLSHPHIAAIYGLEEFGQTPAIVLELVEGPTLADQLLRGPLPVRDALKIGRQIAEALEAAHEKGIVHRDLKPANVKIAPGGFVKVLDFGLAKALESGESGDFDRSAETATGVVMGTSAYMSPEQARGQLCDERTDIWAFGCVLFELLTGQAAFRQPTVSDTIAAVIDREPDWRRLPKDTPDGIRRLLSRCLQKDPHTRLHNISDVRIELDEEIAAAKSGAMPGAGRTAVRLAGRGWALAAIAIVAVLGTFLWSRREVATPPLSDLRITRLTDLAGLEEFPAVSPDGRAVAFAAGVDGSRHVFVQLAAGGESLQLTRDRTDHEFARWTADSSSVVYFTPGASPESQGTLWQVSALGGPPRRLIDSVGGADVNRRDGRLAFFRMVESGVQLVTTPPDASSAAVVAGFPAVTYYLYPRWSPDGRWIAYQRGDSIRFDVFVVPSSGGEPRPLTHDNNMMAGFTWLPDSSGIIYSSSRGNSMPYLPTLSLWHIGLAGGEPRPLASGESSYVHPDLAPNGTVVVGRVRMQSDIWKFPIDGQPADNVRRAERLTRQTGQVLTPTAGPGDREVAFLSDRGGHANVWVLDTRSGESRQITQERDAAVSLGVPVWSPGGNSIAFLSTRGNPGLTFGIWLVNPDGSGLRSAVNPGLGPAWSTDGRWLYYSTRGSTSLDVVMRKIRPEGGEPVTVTTERLRNVIGSDGSTVYYTFERPLIDGRPEFEIRSANPENAPFKVLARISATRIPIWQIVNPSLSPDGQWLAQALTDRGTTNVWALSTRTGEWRQITDFGDRTTFIARRVSWSSDGRAILAALAEGDSDIVSLDGLALGK